MRRSRLETLAPSFQRILCADDLSKETEGVVRASYMFARRLQSSLCYLHVDRAPILHSHYYVLGGAVLPPHLGESEFARLRSDGLAALERRLARARIFGEPSISVEVEFGTPFRVLLDRLEDRDEGIDLIVIGKKRHGVMHDWLLGSLPIQLMQNSPVPVLLLPSVAATAQWEPSRMMLSLAFDGYEEAMLALAGALAHGLGAHLDVVHVHEARDTAHLGEAGQRQMAMGTGDARQFAAFVEERLPSPEDAESGRVSAHMLTGDVISLVETHVVQSQCELLIVGQGGTPRGDVDLLGRTTRTLVHDLETPTLVVPPAFLRPLMGRKAS